MPLLALVGGGEGLKRWNEEARDGGSEDVGEGGYEMAERGRTRRKRKKGKEGKGGLKR